MDQWPIDTIRQAVETTTGHAGQYHGGTWQLRCPAHHDRNPSLTLNENDQHHALIHCHTGCTNEDIMQAINLPMAALYPPRPRAPQDPVIATYSYTDPDGALLYQVERTATKRFRQRRPDPDKPGRWIYNLTGVTRVLYRLPELRTATARGDTIYIVEGEKDADTGHRIGICATTNPGGAGKWRNEYNTELRGAHVVIIADNDQTGTGLAHGRTIAQALLPIAASVTLGIPTEGKDLSDLVEAGLGPDDITIADPLGAPRKPSDGSTPTSIPAGASEADGSQPDGPDRAPDDPAARVVVGRLASSYPMRKASWVWQHLPGIESPAGSGVAAVGEICLIAGREGSGKSTLLAWLAAQITRGTLAGLHHGTPKTVLYATTEDSWSHTIVPRLAAAGADLDRVHHLQVLQEGIVAGHPILPSDLRGLGAYSDEHEAAILLLDPILSMLDDRINPNHARELRGALEPLKAMAETHRIAVAGLVHFNKTRDTDIMSMVAGSRAWTEVARTVVAVARDNEAEDDNPPLVVSQVKNNIGRRLHQSVECTLRDTILEFTDGDSQTDELHVARLVWGDVAAADAETILQRRPNTEGRNREGTQADAILAHLRTQVGAQSPRQIADALTLDRLVVGSQLRRLLMRGLVRRIGDHGLYAAVEGS